VFDWDGTLMDSAAHIIECLQTALTDLELPQKTDSEIKNIIGLGLREALNVLLPEISEHDLTALTARYRDHFFSEEKESSELFSGAQELVDELHHQDYFLAVATGKGRRGLNKVLSETGMGKYFPITRCADESHSKPHPQMLLDIIDWYGVEASETIMIGDTDYDLQMANNAKAHGIAVTYGVHEKQRLLDCNPLTCVNNIEDLKQWLLG
ncbi:MAG: HAD-IA family hydrolase, partial [Gammaproteobacteria bacterium]|nr:HAD-IA family hydrolase [Gammaproteobacteria bacterium]